MSIDNDGRFVFILGAVTVPTRGIGTGRAQPINMFIQGRVDRMPHRIQDEVDPFTSGKLGGRNKIGIASDQNDWLLYRYLLIRSQPDSSEYQMGWGGVRA